MAAEAAGTPLRLPGFPAREGRCQCLGLSESVSLATFRPGALRRPFRVSVRAGPRARAPRASGLGLGGQLETGHWEPDSEHRRACAGSPSHCHQRASEDLSGSGRAPPSNIMILGTHYTEAAFQEDEDRGVCAMCSDVGLRASTMEARARCPGVYKGTTMPNKSLRREAVWVPANLRSAKQQQTGGTRRPSSSLTALLSLSVPEAPVFPLK